MIVIIDYHAGNLTSVARAINHIGFSCSITNDPNKIKNARRIIFPGVGAAGSAIESLRNLDLCKAIEHSFNQGKPILGICLGTQIILSNSQENNTKCLNIISGSTLAFSDDIKSENQNPLKIPHMGWNRIIIQKQHPVISHIKQIDEFYFVHGFYPLPDQAHHVLATTHYGISFPSVIGCDNIIATQFHPEKSGKPGLKLLENFCNWEL